MPWNFAYATDQVKLATAFQFLSSVKILPFMALFGHWFGFTGAVCGYLGVAIAVVLFYAAFWKNVPASELPRRMFGPMVAPLLLYSVALVLYVHNERAHAGIPERIASAAIYGVLFLPLVVRLETLISPRSEAPGTLRRAAERVSRKLPVPAPAMMMIFGRALMNES